MDSYCNVLDKTRETWFKLRCVFLQNEINFSQMNLLIWHSTLHPLRYSLPLLTKLRNHGTRLVPNEHRNYRQLGPWKPKRGCDCISTSLILQCVCVINVYTICTVRRPITYLCERLCIGYVHMYSTSNVDKSNLIFHI